MKSQKKEYESIARAHGFKKYKNPFIHDVDYDKDEHWHNAKQAKYKDWVCQCYRSFPELDRDERYDLDEIINEIALAVGLKKLRSKR